jgi:protein-disulfide isomerase
VSNVSRKSILYTIVLVAALALVVASYLVYTNGSSSTVASVDNGSLKMDITAADHTLGNPNAPLKVVEYGAPSCPICAHWNEANFPQFKAQYIDTGKVFYVFRIFPLRSLDLAVSAMAHCLPRDAYFSFIHMMWRNQSMWDPDGHDIADPHAALLHMGVIAGMTPQQTQACITNQQQLQKASAIGEHAEKAYGINATPTFIVNGQLEPDMGTWQSVQDTLNRLLKAQAQH